MSERRTDATESGSLPTAKASHGDWRTPQAGDGTHNHCEAPAHQRGTVPLMLSVQALRAEKKDWITPQARDGDNRGTQPMSERRAQGHSASLPEQMLDWHTPTANPEAPNTGSRRAVREGRAPKGAEHSLAAQAREWMTPNARDWKDTGPTQGARKSPNPGTTVLRESAWPTPTATDAKASGAAGYSTASGRHTGTTLTDATVGPRGPESRSTTGKSRARLNHRWVAQLMGFPSDWLEGIDVPPSKPSATASSRKSSKPSDEQSEV